MSILFTMNADAQNLVGSGDIEGMSGLAIHFDLNISAGDWLRVTGGVRTVMLRTQRVTGYVRSDGRMYDTAAVSPIPYDITDPGVLGVRLLANDPNLNLENAVSYYVSGSADLHGTPWSFYPFNIPVPATDVAVDLASLTPGPGQTLVGINSVDHLADMTVVGRAVAKAVDAAAARTAIGVGAGGSGVNADWTSVSGASQILNKPTTFAPTIGATSTTAVAGDDARLSDTRTPTDNTVTSAKIVDGAIVNVDINASAGIVGSKLAISGTKDTTTYVKVASDGSLSAATPSSGTGSGDATLADLTKLHAVTATATELNYVGGVTSAIQTQIDAKQPLDADLTALAALTAPATKLSGIATGATANSSDATLLARANHTGTQSADTIIDGTTNKVVTAAQSTVLGNTSGTNTGDQNLSSFATTSAVAAGYQPLDADLTALAALTAPATKLTGIATGATANSSDATLLARANHTGTQTASTISDFSSAADARIAAATATGTGSLVRATSPALTTPTGIVKSDVGLANVDNTSNATERAAVRTLTNARVTSRVNSAASNATPALDATYDATVLTAQAAAITAFSAINTFTAEQKHMLRIKDSGTARAIAWTSTVVQAADGITLPTTTVVGKTHRIGLIYDEVVAKLIAVAVASY